VLDLDLVFGGYTVFLEVLTSESDCYEVDDECKEDCGGADAKLESQFSTSLRKGCCKTDDIDLPGTDTLPRHLIYIHHEHMC